MLPRRLILQCYGRCTDLRSTHIRSIKLLKESRHSTITIRSKRTNATKETLSKNTKSVEETPDNIFGMRPIDYTILPPICHSPPPPPPRPGMRKHIFPLSLLVFGGITAYFYVNNKNDNLEFWMAMQNGEAIDVGEDDEDDENEED